MNPPAGLWRNREFLNLWAAQTVSNFGSMISGTALSFTVLSDTQIRVSLPARVAGTYNLVVTTGGGVNAVSAGSGFRYVTTL